MGFYLIFGYPRSVQGVEACYGLVAPGKGDLATVKGGRLGPGGYRKRVFTVAG